MLDQGPEPSVYRTGHPGGRRGQAGSVKTDYPARVRLI